MVRVNCHFLRQSRCTYTTTENERTKQPKYSDVIIHIVAILLCRLGPKILTSPVTCHKVKKPANVCYFVSSGDSICACTKETI